jgi:hypothetical protein
VDSFACVERIDMDRFGDGAIKKTSCRKQQDVQRRSRGTCLVVLFSDEKQEHWHWYAEQALDHKMRKRVARCQELCGSL